MSKKSNLEEVNTHLGFIPSDATQCTEPAAFDGGNSFQLSSNLGENMRQPIYNNQENQILAPFTSMRKDFVGKIFDTKVESATSRVSLGEPRSATSNKMLRNLLPARVRNPIIVSGETMIANQIEERGDLSDDEHCLKFKPTGMWSSPVVTEALSRQVSKELQFKTLRCNVIRLLSWQTYLLISAKLTQIYFQSSQVTFDVKSFRLFSSSGVANLFKTAMFLIHEYSSYLSWLMVLTIIFNAVELFRPQDQCVDLPLTRKQRELIGLRALSSTENNTTSLTSNLDLSQRLFKVTSSAPLNLPRYARAGTFMDRSKVDDGADTLDS